MNMERERYGQRCRGIAKSKEGILAIRVPANANNPISRSDPIEVEVSR